MVALTPQLLDPEVTDTIRELNRLRNAAARPRNPQSLEKLGWQIRVCVRWLARHGVTA